MYKKFLMKLLKTYTKTHYFNLIFADSKSNSKECDSNCCQLEIKNHFSRPSNQIKPTCSWLIFMCHSFSRNHFYVFFVTIMTCNFFLAAMNRKKSRQYRYIHINFQKLNFLVMNNATITANQIPTSTLQKIIYSNSS